MRPNGLVLKSPLPYEYRGGFYYERGKLELALIEFNEAARLAPDLAEVFHNRGLVYERMRDPTKALADFGATIRLDPKFADACRPRGSVYASLGRAADAERDLAKVGALENATAARGPENAAGNP